MRQRLTLLLMVAVAGVAFASGPIVYADRAGTDVSREALRRLKTQASVAQEGLHPRHLHVTASRSTGPTPDHVDGRVVFRTIFGVAVGDFRLDGGASTIDMHPWRWAFPWLAFFSAEGALGLYLLRHLDL